MPKSMTGYGHARGKVLGRDFLVEAKSVNHKFCEINLKISTRFSALESKIQSFAKEFFTRGRIDLLIREESGEDSPSSYQLDTKKLKAYYQQLDKLYQDLGKKETPSLEALLALPQVLVPSEEMSEEKIWADLKPLLHKGFKSLETMRKQEGKALEKIFLKELKFLEEKLIEIKKVIPQKLKDYRAQLEKRLHKLMPLDHVDPQRLAAEIALFVDRTDASEEIVRCESHFKHFRDQLKKSGPIGRKLDFLLQEINREVNTLSAKSQSALVSQNVVECKHSLERMREQVQNIE
ncbi:MAG: YicC family protein [Deltaproteobacteria bacterium]|nr:YicC family protein [Deltaproteobacteria bacterium]